MHTSAVRRAVVGGRMAPPMTRTLTTLTASVLRRATPIRPATTSPLSMAHAVPAVPAYGQAQRSFSSDRSSSSSSSSMSGVSFLRRVSLLLPAGLHRWAAQVPKGWERFFPKGTATGRKSTKGSDTEGEGDGAGSGGGTEGEEPSRNSRRKSDSPDGGSGGGPFGSNAFGIAQAVIFTVAGLTYVYLSTQAADGQELTYQEFKTRFLEQHLVDKLEVDPTTKKVIVILKTRTPGEYSEGNTPASANSSSSSSSSLLSLGGSSSSAETKPGEHFHFFIGSVESFERSLQETQAALGIDPHDYVSVRYTNSENRMTWLPTLLQLGFYAVIAFIGYRTLTGMGGAGGGKGGKNPFSFGKSTAQLIKPGDSKVTFKDVAGLDDAKVEVMEFVKFLQAPERFKRLGAKIPKGALLCGPPGTGKTLLAKAVAGEAGVPFYSISGSDFLEMFVGVGPSRVRDLFAQARANTPCIIFIDEIDAVGRARSKGGYGGGNDERENTLNQLLVEMDGMGTTEGVVVLAGTNRKDMLDKALLRPGRFDRHISIDKPDMKGRAQIFLVHLAHLKTDAAHTKDDLAQRLAALTPGFAGADIANLCNEAALIAARADKSSIELTDFEKASDRVIGGLEKKSSGMSPEEKSLVAHHEAGHAVAAWFLEHADPLLKVTIVPRGNGALGFAQYLPKELSLYHQAQLSDMMAMALGGRAAEQLFFGRVSTGASDDLQKVTRIAQAQVTTYGMSERLGNVSYAPGQDDNQFVKPFSEATAQAIDEEVRALIATTYKRVLALLEKHRSQVKALADKLIETENVNHDVLLALLGPRPFASDAYTVWRKQSAEAAEIMAKSKADKEAAAAAAAAAQQEKDAQGETPEFTPA